MPHLTTGRAAATGWLIDQLVGEPPARAHPVAWFGTLMRWAERHTYRDTRSAGIVHLAFGVGIALGAGWTLRQLLGRPAATTVATAVSIAGRMLLTEATTIIDTVERGDLDAARALLPTLVGRDVDNLTNSEINRAVIESVAENTVDAVTAPLVWAALGGAPAVLMHRAINTLDAMVGHRNDHYLRFGWASARADDILNWLPARLGAIGVACLVPHRVPHIVATVRRDAPRHPSPNGGVIEAAFAGALTVQLGGVNRYAGLTDDRGTLGDGSAPDAAIARRAIALARALGALTATAAALPGR